MGVVLVPILEGKFDSWKQWAAALNNSEDMKDLNSRYGLTRHAAWLVETPSGPAVIALHEGPGSDEFMQKLASSDNAVDVRFKDSLKEFHGMDLTQPPPGPMPELFFDN